MIVCFFFFSQVQGVNLDLLTRVDMLRWDEMV